MSVNPEPPLSPLLEGGTLQKVDCESLNTLIQQYEMALEGNTSKKEEYQKFKNDYLKLKSRLKSLPDKLEYDAMVPLCSKALCPGKIIHTNEILCLLGDNWFVECTAKKAAEIVSHRIKSIDDTLNRLEKERELYNAWKFEAERQMVETLGDGTIEIMEDYNEETEKEWKKFHREKVRKHHQNLAQERQKKSKDIKGERNEKELWTRLDALELEEEFMEAQVAYEEKNNESEGNQENRSDIRRSNPNLSDIEKTDEMKNDSSVNNSGKKVTFSPENIIHNLAGLSLKDAKKRVKDGGEESEKEDIELYKPSDKCENGSFDPIFIRFRHGGSSSISTTDSQHDTEEILTSDSDDDSEDEDNYQIVISPGDIYEQFGPPSLETKAIIVPGADKAPLKSILKPRGQIDPRFEESFLSRKQVRITAKATNKTNVNCIREDSMEEEPAVVPKVIERVPVPMGMSVMFPYFKNEPEVEPPTEESEPATAKPVSLFKKRRQGMLADDDGY